MNEWHSDNTKEREYVNLDEKNINLSLIKILLI